MPHRYLVLYNNELMVVEWRSEIWYNQLYQLQFNLQFNPYDYSVENLTDDIIEIIESYNLINEEE